MWGREIIIHLSFSSNSCKINSKPMFFFCFFVFFSLCQPISPVSIETACLKRFQSIWNDAMVLLVISNYLLVDEGHLVCYQPSSQAAGCQQDWIVALPSSFTDELAGSVDRPGIMAALFVV